MNIRAEVYVMNEDNFIYKVASVEEMSVEKDYGLCYMLELVLGYDYINTDTSNAQGYVGAENFVEGVQWDTLTVYPLEETLGDRLEEQGYKVINIKDYCKES